MSAITHIIAIQSMKGDLWSSALPGLSIEIFDEIDLFTLHDITKKITPTSAIILEKNAFADCEINMREYIQQVRKCGQNPRILVLRCKNHGKDNPKITDGDIEAGANDVIWYQSSMSVEEITSKVDAFILNNAPSKVMSESSQMTRTKPARVTKSSRAKVTLSSSLATPFDTTSSKEVIANRDNDAEEPAIKPVITAHVIAKTEAAARQMKQRLADVTLSSGESMEDILGAFGSSNISSAKNAKS